MTAGAFGALAHLNQADAATGAGSGGGLCQIKARAIVPHAQNCPRVIVESQFDPDVFRVRVFAYIVQRFLG